MASKSDIDQRFAALSEEDKLPYRLLVAIKQDDVETATELLVCNDIDVNFRSELFFKGHTLLIRAAFDSPGMCKVLLDRGADINLGESKYNATPLICAAEHNTESCRVLLEAGADPNMPDSSGSRPLHAAAQANISAIPLLLAAGADVHVRELRDIGGRQPLHYAAQNDQEACKLLLDAGADVNAPLDSEEAETAILVAASKEPKCCQVLIDAGADVNVAFNSTGSTPLHEVSDSEIDASVAKALLKAGARTDVRDKTGIAPLHFAAKGNAEVCQALLEAGADVNITTEGTEPELVGWTPLSIAANMGESDVACAKILVDHGADMEAKLKGDKNTTALHIAAQKNAGVCKILLEAGANLETTDDEGNYAVHLAALGNNVESMEHLVAHGVSVNVTNKSMGTPLNAAVLSDSTDAVRFLVDKGADIKSRNEDGWTPFHFAAMLRPEATQVLIDKGADVETKMSNGMTPLFAAANGNPESLNILIEAGANINAQADDGSTPLFTSSEKHISTTKILIEAGCLLDIQDVKGLTALHTAAGDNHVICKMLLDAGAKFDIASQDETLPLHSAAIKGNVNSIQHLIDKGAVVDAVDNNGWTALHHAVLRSAECVRVLLLAGAEAEKKTDLGLSAYGLCMQTGKDADVLATLLSRGKCDAAKEKKRKREAEESGSSLSEDDD